MFARLKRLLIITLLAAAALAGGGYWYATSHAYRSAHGSTVEVLDNGDVLVAWYTGFDERCANVAIVMARRPAGKKAFEPARIVADTAGKSDGNPVLWQAPDGVVHLFYGAIDENNAWYFGVSWADALLYHQTSADNGRTWSEPAVFRKKRGYLLRNKPVVLAGGDVLLSAYDEARRQSLFYRSTDGGKTWAEDSARLVSNPGNIQPAVIEAPGKPGRLRAWLRYHKDSFADGGRLWLAESTDGGGSWSAPVLSEIKNPNAAVDALVLRSGAVALVFNDSETEGVRTPLTVALSDDGGKTFPTRRALVDKPGEYSYPAVVQGPDGSLLISFTWRREAISFVRVTEDWVRGKPGAKHLTRTLLRYERRK